MLEFHRKQAEEEIDPCAQAAPEDYDLHALLNSYCF
jgi:hypothetical protein